MYGKTKTDVQLLNMIQEMMPGEFLQCLVLILIGYHSLLKANIFLPYTLYRTPCWMEMRTFYNPSLSSIKGISIIDCKLVCKECDGPFISIIKLGFRP